MTMTGEQRDGAAGVGTAGEAPRTIDSTVLGRVAVPAESLYTLPAGLLGFEGYTRFALVPSGREGVLWLQSTEEPSLAFVVADPFRLAAGYAAELPDADAAAIGAARPEHVMLLVVVTLTGAPGGTPTANLRAPLAFNVETRRGRQVVLPDDRFGTAEAVTL
jgi:flagellar assembly factor FliW